MTASEQAGEGDEYVVLDFETTGLSADRHRVIEVGAYLVRAGQITDSFAALCNPRKKLSAFIVKFTGITDEMLQDQPSPEDVMRTLRTFLGDRPIVAHNASFDSKFLIKEMSRIGHEVRNAFVCTLLLSRRLFPAQSSFKLARLQAAFDIRVPAEHRAHRALDDAFVTVHLFSLVCQGVMTITRGASPTVEVLVRLAKVPKADVTAHLLADKAPLRERSPNLPAVIIVLPAKEEPKEERDVREGVPAQALRGDTRARKRGRDGTRKTQSKEQTSIASFFSRKSSRPSIPCLPLN